MKKLNICLTSQMQVLYGLEYAGPLNFIIFFLVDASSGSHVYDAEANSSSALNVDELHQEISVRSIILIIPLIIVWTHTYSLEYFLENP